MEIIIAGRNLEVTESIDSYVRKKFERLNRHLPMISQSNIELADEKTKAPEVRFVVQVTLNCNGTLLRGEERGLSLFAAIDGVAQVMDRQIEKFKGKLYKKEQAHTLARKQQGLENITGLPEVFTEENPMIVRSKRFPMKPMAPEEAIDQMELLGHDFFFFMNSLTGKYNVAYQRKDGRFGLIEPD